MVDSWKARTTKLRVSRHSPTDAGVWWEGTEDDVHRGASSLQPIERAQRHQVLKSMHRRSTAQNSTGTCKSCSVRCARVACLPATRRGHSPHAMPGKASTRARHTAPARSQRECTRPTFSATPPLPATTCWSCSPATGHRRAVARHGFPPRSPTGYPSGPPHGPKGLVRNLHTAPHRATSHSQVRSQSARQGLAAGLLATKSVPTVAGAARGMVTTRRRSHHLTGHGCAEKHPTKRPRRPTWSTPMSAR